MGKLRRWAGAFLIRLGKRLRGGQTIEEATGDALTLLALNVGIHREFDAEIRSRIGKQIRIGDMDFQPIDNPDGTKTLWRVR